MINRKHRCSSKESAMFVTRSHFTAIGLALLVAICMVNSSRAGQPSFTPIDFPGASLTEAFGISPEGDIAGSYGNATGIHGFLLSKGAFTPIEFPGASFTAVWEINAQGDIVGNYSSSTTGPRGFLLSKGAFTTIGFPGASVTEAQGINDEGDIVGF